MQQSTKIRPAATTIALVLAGTAAAPLWAQDTTIAPPPVVTTAPVAAAPVAAAPVAAAPSAVAPPPIARTVAPATSASAEASRTTVDAGALAQAEAERPAPRQAAPASARTASVNRVAAPVATTAAPAGEPVADAAPVAPAVAPPSNDAAELAAASAPSEPAVTGDAASNAGIPVSWLLGGLGAVALLGLAAAMVLRRRRDAEYHAIHAHAEYTDRPAEPAIARTAPAVASPALAAGPVRAADGHLMGRHEALAMQGPSTDNPFLTLKNRLKRARFYDRQERMAGVAQRPASPFDPKPAAAQPAREAGMVRANVRPARQSAFGWPGAAKPAMG